MGGVTARFALEQLKKAGSEKSVATVRIGEVKELNIEGGKLTLLRSTFNTSVGLKALIGDRKGSVSINKLDEESVKDAASQAALMARSSEPDPANEIAEGQESASFSCGIENPDLDLMYERLKGFLDWVKNAYPHTILEQSILKFVTGESWFCNSNGVEFSTKRGHYDFGAMFTTKKDGKSSSFNSTGYSSYDLDTPLWERGTVETRIMQNAGQLNTKPVPEKFVGEVIIAPDCLMSFLSFLIRNISDFSLITGTSPFKDQLGKKIAADALTIRSAPLSEELVENYFITGDGYPVQNLTIVDKGILSSFLLSLYGARKTGGERALSSGGCYIIDPGTSSIEEMVKSVERGVLVCRASGGRPGSNGDFSSVVKNSYAIEEGRITDPLSETMISGNVVNMLTEIKGVSSERVNFGGSILPWVRFGGLTVSGK